jgi:hypothetical protein
MDIGKEIRVIEVEEPSVSPRETEEIVVEVTVTEPADPYPRRI